MARRLNDHPFGEHLRGCGCLECFATWLKAKREATS